MKGVTGEAGLLEFPAVISAATVVALRSAGKARDAEEEK
jgi:hypothetical protein